MSASVRDILEYLDTAQQGSIDAATIQSFVRKFNLQVGVALLALKQVSVSFCLGN